MEGRELNHWTSTSLSQFTKLLHIIHLGTPDITVVHSLVLILGVNNGLVEGDIGGQGVEQLVPQGVLGSFPVKCILLLVEPLNPLRSFFKTGVQCLALLLVVLHLLDVSKRSQLLQLLAVALQLQCEPLPPQLCKEIFNVGVVI